MQKTQQHAHAHDFALAFAATGSDYMKQIALLRGVESALEKQDHPAPAKMIFDVAKIAFGDHDRIVNCAALRVVEVVAQKWPGQINANIRERLGQISQKKGEFREIKDTADRALAHLIGQPTALRPIAAAPVSRATAALQQ